MRTVLLFGFLIIFNILAKYKYNTSTVLSRPYMNFGSFIRELN